MKGFGFQPRHKFRPLNRGFSRCGTISRVLRGQPAPHRDGILREAWLHDRTLAFRASSMPILGERDEQDGARSTALRSCQLHWCVCPCRVGVL